MGLPFDVFVIGDSWAAFNWHPGTTRTPVKVSASFGSLNIPLLNLIRAPQGAPNGFDSGGGYWFITDPGSSGSYPDGVHGWTTRGLLRDNFNTITGLNIDDANFHFYGRANATLHDTSGTGQWDNFTDTRTWAQTDPATGKTAFETVKHPPTGRGVILANITGNDWLNTFHQFQPNALYNGSPYNATLRGISNTAARSMLDTLYAANPLLDIHIFSYTNMCAAESDTGGFAQYNGNPLPVAQEDTAHFGLTNVAAYPNPPGTRFCPQLTSPDLKPNQVTNVSFTGLVGITSPVWSRVIWASDQMQNDYLHWDNAGNTFAVWYAHWYADQNFTPGADPIFHPFWTSWYNEVIGSAATTQINTCRIGWGTQTICNKLLNASFQDYWNNLWSPIESDYQAAGFNLHAHQMWTSLSGYNNITNGTGQTVVQVGTDNPATQSVNKYGFFDGQIHLDKDTADEYTKQCLAVFRSTSPFAPTLHGMKLSSASVGSVAVMMYEGVPSFGSQQIYVDIYNSGGQDLYVGDNTVTIGGGANPGIKVAAGATFKMVIWGSDDIWVISNVTGTTCSLLRTGRS